MPEETPYLEQKPGDLITAEKWNELQRLIRGDIAESIEEAVRAITEVDQAGDSMKLEGMSLAEITAKIVDRAVAECHGRDSSMKLFLHLRQGETRTIEHGLGACPWVDLYQLDPFPVVCCEDKDTFPAWTFFYAFHGDEKTLRVEVAPGQRVPVEIQPRQGPAWRVPVAAMLEHLGVEISDDQALSDVLNELWKALFRDPNDSFEDDHYCHSPWFEKCCREEMRVADVKRKKHWDDLFIQWRPRKTVNLAGGLDATDDVALATPAPTQIQVSHFDFDTLGLELLRPPIRTGVPSAPEGFPSLEIDGDELQVMALLKI
ncbi:MAG: hypothetical protein AAF725_13255 [Acidobacteriota bacterium]